MSLNLITDRTAADLAAAREIIAKVQRGETLTEAEQSQFDAGLRGCYNASDLNRVEAAVQALAAELNAAGYTVEVGETKHTTVPEGYTILEYLQSTGTQYIDSGVVGSSNTRVIADFAITGLGSGTTFVFGAQGTDSVRYTLGITSAGVFRSDYGTEMTSGSAAALNTRYKADKNQNVCTVNDSTITSTAQTFTGTTNIYLFARSYSSLSYSQIKLYSCKIYSNGTMVRNMIPAKNSSGTLGLYDTVNGAFYTNAGTGTFSAGSEIETESHDWQTTDIIRLSQWRQYLANVQALRDAYTALSTTPELPQPTDKLGFEGANNIERVLADIDTLISCMIASYRRCGAFNAGDNAAHLPLKGSAN